MLYTVPMPPVSAATYMALAFRRYYFESAGKIGLPARMGEREFGFQEFGTGTMRRHVSLSDRNGLTLLLSRGPSDVYASCSYYSRPDLPMAEKGWKGADLIFDIDAKDIGLPCREGHTVRVCAGCSAVSQDKECSGCGSTGYSPVSLPCHMCVAAAKREVDKLLDVLSRDFGVTEEAVEVSFSGNDGFHVAVKAPRLERMDSRGRRDVARHCMFAGAMPEAFGVLKDMKQADLDGVLPRPDAPAWKGRLARALWGTLADREIFIARLDGNVHRQFGAVLREQTRKAGVIMDMQVTADTSRIFRMTGTLSGKSGLLKAPCADIGPFDPYVDACVIRSNEARVTASCPICFEIGGTRCGPYNSETVSVPEYAAVYMMAKGLARPA